MTEVVVDNFSLLESRAESDKRRAQNGSSEPSHQGGASFGTPSDNAFGGVDPFATASQANPQATTPTNDAPNPFAASGKTEIDISDDDLPF